MRKQLKTDENRSALSELQVEIVNTVIEHPEWTYDEIAAETGASSSYVGTTHRGYVEEIIEPRELDWEDITDDLYEKIVAGLEAREDVDRVVQSYDLPLSQGCSKEVDVAVWSEAGRREFLTIIECKFHEEPIEQEVVSGMIRNMHNSNANMTVLVSKSGFQRGALCQARDAGVELYTLKQLEEDDLEDRVQRIEFEVVAKLPEYEIRRIDLRPTIEVDDTHTIPSNKLNGYTRLWKDDYESSSETLYDLGSEISADRDPGIYTVDIDGNMILVDGIFYHIDSIELEVLPEQTSSGTEGSVDIFEIYDLVMIDEFADTDEDREFSSLEEALNSFLENAE
jgi:hypothetical protein